MSSKNTAPRLYKDLFRRNKPQTSKDDGAPFQVGDEVYIHTGPHKHYSGVVQKMMPVMMEVLVTNGAKQFDVIKCKHTSARLIASTEQHASPNTSRKEMAIVGPDGTGISPEDREKERSRALNQLQEAVTALEEEHQARMKHITAIVARINLLG